MNTINIPFHISTVIEFLRICTLLMQALPSCVGHVQFYGIDIVYSCYNNAYVLRFLHMLGGSNVSGMCLHYTHFIANITIMGILIEIHAFNAMQHPNIVRE